VILAESAGPRQGPWRTGEQPAPARFEPRRPVAFCGRLG